MNRHDAGKQLAQHLFQYKQNPRAIVLGIPRGGVLVAAEIARTLQLPLDILVIKKIGFPGNAELAIGATTGTSVFLNQGMIARNAIAQSYLRNELKKKQHQAQRRESFLRGKKSLPILKGKIVILTDDGAATGITMQLAVQVVRQQKPAKIMVALPLASREAVVLLKKVADEIICLEQPMVFEALSQFYENFEEVTEQEVKQLLNAV